MFPLGIAYFVALVTLLAVGGSLIWTFPGALIVLFAIFGSRLVGDAEAFIVSRVSGTEIKRPPWRTEGTEGWRSRLWVRLIDPTTWTGIVYLFVQFPIGIGVFVSLVVVFAVAGSFVASPIIVQFTDDPLEMSFGWWSLVIDTPAEALWLVPVGLAILLPAVHLMTAASALHAIWAKFMLGSRAKTAPEPTAPVGPSPTGGESEESPAGPPLARERDAVRPFGPPAPQGGILREQKPPPDRPGAMPPEVAASITPLIGNLTPRESEVVLLLAAGMSNAEIAEKCFISQGTVKTHVKRVLAKLQLHDRAQVVVFAYETGLVTPGSEQRKSAAINA